MTGLPVGWPTPFVCVAALALTLMASGASAAADWPPAGLTCPSRTVVIFGPGPSPEKASSLFATHLAFVRAHLQSGDALVMGPLGTDGGLAVLPGTDWGAIGRFLDEEPFTRAGVLRVVRHDIWAACADAGPRADQVTKR